MLSPPNLIETVRIRGGHAPLWYLHLRRLAASCGALGIPFPPAFDVPAGGADRVHRLEVGMEGVTISTRPVGDVSPVRLVTSSVFHPGYCHKVTERTAFVSADEAARQAGADAPLLLTGEGIVAESSIWSLFWWEGDTLAAPARELEILEGVSRRRIAEIVGQITQRRVQREELDGRAIFLSNAARGIVQVVSLDGIPVPSHPGTDRLREAFWP